MELKTILYWQDKFENYLSDNPSDDASHDLSHFRRVWKLAKNLSCYDCDELVLLASAYFHDIVSYPKNHPRRSESSRDAALKAESILSSMDFPQEKMESVKHCIEAHSFSANIETKTLEAKIIQDADRMESLGAIGLARTFYVAGRMGSQLFCAQDPFAQKRELDDKKYCLDHFETKLLKLPATMKTQKGKEEADRRASILRGFLVEIGHELN